jgi:hypothetical protein
VGIKVNVSEQEDKSGDREPLPVGKYHMAITDCRLDSPKQGDNVGKPMLVFEFTVQDSDDSQVQGRKAREFVNRKDFVNACLWEGALYTIVGILKAINEYKNCTDENGNLEVPDDPEFYLGRQLYVRRATNRRQREQWPDNPDYWVQASGYSPYGTKEERATASTGASADSSLLP